jgi:hypothetical protein
MHIIWLDLTKWIWQAYKSFLDAKNFSAQPKDSSRLPKSMPEDILIEKEI